MNARSESTAGRRSFTIQGDSCFLLRLQRLLYCCLVVFGADLATALGVSTSRKWLHLAFDFWTVLGLFVNNGRSTVPVGVAAVFLLKIAFGKLSCAGTRLFGALIHAASVTYLSGEACRFAGRHGQRAEAQPLDNARARRIAWRVRDMGGGGEFFL
jgi:hypothetical protein